MWGVGHVECIREKINAYVISVERAVA
jgi:hypothetical protein